MRTDLSGPEWEGIVEDFASTALRWEQQPVYAEDLATGWPQRWRDGDRTPPTDIAEFADNVLAPLSSTGRVRIRVRLVDDPETWVQEWADWAAELNRAAGEVIHRMSRTRAQALGLIDDPLTDWWFVDDKVVLLLRFDEEGQLYQVDLDDAPATVVRCRQVWNVAMEEVAPA